MTMLKDVLHAMYICIGVRVYQIICRYYSLTQKYAESGRERIVLRYHLTSHRLATLDKIQSLSDCSPTSFIR